MSKSHADLLRHPTAEAAEAFERQRVLQTNSETTGPRGLIVSQVFEANKALLLAVRKESARTQVTQTLLEAATAEVVNDVVGQVEVVAFEEVSDLAPNEGELRIVEIRVVLKSVSDVVGQTQIAPLLAQLEEMLERTHRGGFSPDQKESLMKGVEFILNDILFETDERESIVTPDQLLIVLNRLSNYLREDNSPERFSSYQEFDSMLTEAREFFARECDEFHVATRRKTESERLLTLEAQAAGDAEVRKAATPSSPAKKTVLSKSEQEFRIKCTQRKLQLALEKDDKGKIRDLQAELNDLRNGRLPARISSPEMPTIKVATDLKSVLLREKSYAKRAQEYASSGKTDQAEHFARLAAQERVQYPHFFS